MSADEITLRILPRQYRPIQYRLAGRWHNGRIIEYEITERHGPRYKVQDEFLLYEHWVKLDQVRATRRTT